MKTDIEKRRLQTTNIKEFLSKHEYQIYWDNVAGETLEAVLDTIAVRGRIIGEFSSVHVGTPFAPKSIPSACIPTGFTRLLSYALDHAVPSLSCALLTISAHVCSACGAASSYNAQVGTLTS